MARRPGGVDALDIDNALKVLNTAQSIEDLERMVDELPVLSTPFFHAILRQEYLRLNNEKVPYLQNFANMYQALFMSLHFRAHLKLCESASRTETASQNISPSFVPPFFAQIAHVLKDRVPAPKQWGLDPVTDLLQIQNDVAEIVGQSVELPVYEPVTGSKWNAVIVTCAACGHEWLTFQAYAVDLLRAPQLAELLREGRINNSACPRCAETLCFPKGLWIQEAPGTCDVLAALSCAWRLTDSVFVYQPPPGTQRIEDNDRILEIRFEVLMERLGWSEILIPKLLGRHLYSESDRQKNPTHLPSARFFRAG
jgi:hypothetical protein